MQIWEVNFPIKIRQIKIYFLYLLLYTVFFEIYYIQQRAVFYKGNEKVSSFIKIYPIGTNRNYFKEDKEWKNRDLEGDMCQITHFAIIDAPSF